MTRTDAVPVILASLFLFAFVGFMGLSDDNTQYLLGAYKLADPGFLKNDWFVQETQSFHPFFEHYVLWWLNADALVTGLFVWFAVDLLLVSAALLVWLRTLGQAERPLLALLVAAAILVVGVRHGWGQYELLADKALPAYLAYPTALIALALLFHRRYFSAACAVAATFAIHHGLGALLVLCLAGPFLVTLPRSRREVILAGLGGLMIVLLFLPLVFGTMELDAGHAEDFAIFFYGRAPQHYAVQYSGLGTHLASLHVFTVSVLLATMLPAPALRLKLLALVAGVAMLCVLGYLLLEVWYVPAFVRLFPYRALPILIAINACMAAFLLLRESTTRVDLLTVIAVLLSSLVFRYSLSLWAALLAAAILMRFLPRSGLVLPKERRAALVLVCAIGSAALMIDRHLQPPQYFTEPRTVRFAALGKAVEAHTPEDAVIVVPPWIAGVRLILNRAVVINVKAFPVYAGEMAEWADRIRDVSGIDPRDARRYLDEGVAVWQLYFHGYQQRTADELCAAARKYGADFLLVSTRSRFHMEANEARMPVLWSGNGLVLYRTPEAAI